MMNVKSFSPCSDWFFVYNGEDGKRCEMRLAGWAVVVMHDGTDAVVGMVAQKGKVQLDTVPCVEGLYLHESDMPRPIEL